MSRIVLMFVAVIFSSLAMFQTSTAAEPIALGSRLELFVDEYLQESLQGDLQRRVEQPTPAEVVLVTDAPWEGNTCAYYTILQDGDLYRMYYRGSHFNEETRRAGHREVTCYAESRDGIHWTKPELGLFEFEGSKANNIILDGLGTHCFVAFVDENPNCPPEARYKGISHGKTAGNKGGLFVFQSPDGIHWELMKDEPVITEGAFDSQNLAFWDAHTGQYLDYHRVFVKGVRDIVVCKSDDFVNWTKPELLQYPGAPNQHLYTNAIRPYHRAPHLLIGFPTRYLPAESQVEPVFMSSRDRRTFLRYDDPVIPRDAPEERQGNRSNYMAHGLITIPSEPGKMSVFGTEAYYTGPDSRLRRFSYRQDGFIALSSGAQGGTFVSKPVTFTGTQLVLNGATREAGEIRVEVQQADGTSIPGLTLTDCQPVQGDHLAAVVNWSNAGEKLAKLAGQPVRLRFQLRNADLYSFQFTATESAE